MKKFKVIYCIGGWVEKEVYADSKEDAKKLVDSEDLMKDPDFNLTESFINDIIEEK